MEIGSFIELQFPKGKEYYAGNGDIARLNSGRAAIYHALCVYSKKTLWLPYYQCDTVRDFLKRKKVTIRYYHIDENFNPLDLEPADNDAVLLVNYYGVMSNARMKELSKKYKNVIIDNSQAFFNQPIRGCLNVYSARKFMGVPDGSYVIGANANSFIDDYSQGYSSDTSLFLLQRIEHGCEGECYKSRMTNERRIDNEDVLKMSLLSRKILDGIDYSYIKEKRKINFSFAADLFRDINKIDPLFYYDDECVPMVYPLVIENEKLMGELIKAKHFQGHWWSYLLDEVDSNTFEYYLSKYIIPITIDQRYDVDDVRKLFDIVKDAVK